jgi:MFS family permease
VPFFFERVQHLSALETGEVVIGQGLAMAVGLAFSGRLYNQVGPRALAMVGAVLVTVSIFGFTRLTVATTGADLQVWMILRGLGLGLFIQPLQTLSVSVVSRQQMARATSLRNSTTTVVNAVGVAVFTSYLTQHATTHLGEATITCATQSGPSLQQAALQACTEQQTLTLGMNDTFFLAFIACAVCAVATILVGRDPALHTATDFNSKRAAAEAALKALQSAPVGGNA